MKEQAVDYEHRDVPVLEEVRADDVRPYQRCLRVGVQKDRVVLPQPDVNGDHKSWKCIAWGTGLEAGGGKRVSKKGVHCTAGGSDCGQSAIAAPVILPLKSHDLVGKRPGFKCRRYANLDAATDPKTSLVKT